ncbi:putative quinol monooxygenase [Sinorhizobium sp. 7-81]|uniref:putative quinol monooxygenase n=1 Tax=Sinorhizobium sp. 8-89 TaxID=3049089 RepID=UPI0024C22256|nr:putative quinol monooxygenase [Sinorhizobium sp. 8-89]MDK1492481.1 putative quinol monooxygenase [Sinorhizobium sp. 8-89]
MAELTNVAFFRAKPGRSEDLGAALLALVSPSRQEAGSLRYEIHQSMESSNDWMVVEDWRYPSDFDEHMATSYVRDFLVKVPDLCVTDVEIRGFQQRSAPHV